MINGKMKPAQNPNVIKHIVSGSPGYEHRYIPDYAQLASSVKTLKEAGYRVVLTQGVYDLFHVGHQRYLEEAKKLGDILIVGVDTDELTRKRKGPKRPFDKLEDRLEILAGLRAVDIVTIRKEEDHVDKLAKVVKPHVFVISETTSDFSEKSKQNLLKYCGEVKVLPAQAATTTTAKLRTVMSDGAQQLGERITHLIGEYLRSLDHESSSSLHSGPTSGTRAVLSKSPTERPLRSGKNVSRRA